MTFRIYEFSGRDFSVGRDQIVIPQFPNAVQSVSVGSSVSTASGLQGNTNVVMLDTDAGAYALVGSSASTTIVTSTSGIRVIANVPLTLGVKPYSRITVLST